VIAATHKEDMNTTEQEAILTISMMAGFADGSLNLAQLLSLIRGQA
jgi:hypothetical protein